VNPVQAAVQMRMQQMGLSPPGGVGAGAPGAGGGVLGALPGGVPGVLGAPGAGAGAGGVGRAVGR